jgi:Ca2+-binding EF-hand superfamily protein
LCRGEIGISDSDIEKLIREVDVNHDNLIDYSEFLEMMKNDLKV